MQEENINSDLSVALKEKDSLKASVLRMIKSSIGNKKIIGHGEISEDDILKVIKTELKQAIETLDALIANNRDSKEQEKKIEIIKSYLPQQLSEKEIKELVDNAIRLTNSSSISDMGKVVGMVMTQAQGKADGSVVSKLAKEKLL